MKIKKLRELAENETAVKRIKVQREIILKLLDERDELRVSLEFYIAKCVKGCLDYCKARETLKASDERWRDE